MSNSDSFDSNIENTEKSENEEEIKNKLEEIDFDSLLKAKAKMTYQQKKENKKISKSQIKEKLKLINKNKDKMYPKEYSALIKPQFQFKEKKLLGKKFSRDPRFDDLSGKLNETAFNKNYSFVNQLANNYINDINHIKHNKKYKKKLTQDSYELLKKQNNFVKGWLNQQKQYDEQRKKRNEINKENKIRYNQGKKPIFINNNKLKKFA